MRDFFIVVRQPKEHDVTVRALGQSIRLPTRDVAMATAAMLSAQTDEPYIVLGVVGRTGPAEIHDVSHAGVLPSQIPPSALALAS